MTVQQTMLLLSLDITNLQSVSGDDTSSTV